jgi:hypothetical protein
VDLLAYTEVDGRGVMNVFAPWSINTIAKMLGSLAVSLTLAHLVSWLVSQWTPRSDGSAKLEAGLAVIIALALPFVWKRIEVSSAFVEPSRE